jgi:hypothetical protein
MNAVVFVTDLSTMGSQFDRMSPWPCPLWSLVEECDGEVSVPLALLGMMTQVPVNPVEQDAVLTAVVNPGKSVKEVWAMRSLAMELYGKSDSW